MTCHVDEQATGEVFPDCTLDYQRSAQYVVEQLSDCTVAVELNQCGKSRKDCQHWRELETKERP